MMAIKLTAREVEKSIREKNCDLNRITIEGNIDLVKIGIDRDLNMRTTYIKGYLNVDDDVTFEGHLDLSEAIVEGNVTLLITMKGSLIMKESKIIGHLNLGGSTINKLFLKDATIKGELNLRNTIIAGTLDISTKEGPTRIIVNSIGMAERVHYAAPTVPIVIMR